MAIKFLNTVAVDTDVLYVDASSNKVGIGTTSPSQALEVNGNIQATGTRSISSLFDANHYMRLESNSSGGILKGADGGVITTLVRTYGDSYFNGGNVGIGTTTPGTKLDIVGGIQFDKQLASNNYNGASKAFIHVSSGSGAVKFKVYKNVNTTDGYAHFKIDRAYDYGNNRSINVAC